MGDELVKGSDKFPPNKQMSVLRKVVPATFPALLRDIPAPSSFNASEFIPADQVQSVEISLLMADGSREVFQAIPYVERTGYISLNADLGFKLWIESKTTRHGQVGYGGTPNQAWFVANLFRKGK